jgi:hypothetical protein
MNRGNVTNFHELCDLSVDTKYFSIDRAIKKQNKISDLKKKARQA